MSRRPWFDTPLEGTVNLKVNHSSRRDRQLYPDPDAESKKDRHVLAAYWLEVGGSTPAKDEYVKLPNIPQVLSALTMIDNFLMQGKPIPKTFMESFTEGGTKILEIKAPQRGTRISRLLAYRESEWNIFIALAREKKSNQLPPGWKKTAHERIRDALAEGKPL